MDDKEKKSKKESQAMETMAKDNCIGCNDPKQVSATQVPRMDDMQKQIDAEN